MKRKYIAVLLLPAISILLINCKKRKEEQLNESLYNESMNSALVFYKGIDSTYSPAGGSPHGPFKLKVNSTASAALTDNGRLPSGATFPDGSLIVKELYSGSTLTTYVVMKKDRDSKFKSEGDWLWGEYKADGSLIYSAGKKGESCISCHTSGAVRDYTRSFDLH